VSVEKLGAHAVRVEFADQVHRLVVRHSLDADAFARRDVKRFAAGVGVGAHDRMCDVGRFVELGSGEFRTWTVGHPPARGIAMDRLQAGEALFHSFGQCFVCSDSVREDGIPQRSAVALRHLLRIKQRAAARAAPVGGVGMPGEAGIG